MFSFLLIPRYNHDKIIGEFRQSYLKPVSSIFTMEDTFLFFRHCFYKEKAPAHHISVKGRGLFPLVINSVRGNGTAFAFWRVMFFCLPVLWDCLFSTATHNQKASDNRRGHNTIQQKAYSLLKTVQSAIGRVFLPAKGKVTTILFSLFAHPASCVMSIRQRSTKTKTLPLTETRKRKGVELNILLSYQSQHVRTSKADTSCYSARHLKHF